MVKIRAAIFDMDGTLVDNMRFHVRAWVELATQLGLVIPEQRFERAFNGMKNDEIVPRMLGRDVSAEELEKIAEAKEARYRELYRPHLQLLAGASELIGKFAQAGTRLAVATAAPEANRELVLDGLAIRGRFQAVIGAEDAPRGKPSPDIFLAAATRLGVGPEEAVVFEDSANGVLAARAAGMLPVGVLTTAPADELQSAGAAHLIEDFTSLPSPLERLLFV